MARCIVGTAGVRVSPKPIGSARSAMAAAIKKPTCGHAPDVVNNTKARCMVVTVGAGVNPKPIGSAKQEDYWRMTQNGLVLKMDDETHADALSRLTWGVLWLFSACLVIGTR